jgi:hypothetical protein
MVLTDATRPKCTTAYLLGFADGRAQTQSAAPHSSRGWRAGHVEASTTPGSLMPMEISGIAD